MSSHNTSFMDVDPSRSRIAVGQPPPPPKLPARGAENTKAAGAPTNVAINAFPIDIRAAVPEVHKYELIFIAVTEKGKELILHTKGGKDDVIVQFRRNILRELVKVIKARHAEELGMGNVDDQQKPMFVFDGGCSVYLRVAVQNFDGCFDKADIPPPVLELVRGVAEVKYTFRWVELVRIKGAEDTRPACQFLDVLTWQKVHEKGNHLQFQNKAYYLSSSYDMPLGQDRELRHLVAKEGFEKNVRSVGNGLCMQMDSKCSPFFASNTLVEYCQSMCSTIHDIGTNRHLHKLLKGVVVETFHLGKGKDRRFEIRSITRDGAKDIMFEMRTEVEGQTRSISVFDYYVEKYKTRLKYPEAGMVVEMRGPSHTSYHPIEVLRVVKGQRVPNTKSTPAMIESLITKSQKRPDALVDAIGKQRYKAYLDGGSNDCFDHFGVKLDKNMVVAEGTQIFPPEIKYGNAVPQSDQKFPEKWRLNNVRYTQPAVQKGHIFCLVFDRCINMDCAQRAMRNLLEMGRSHGMTVDHSKLTVIEMATDYGRLGEFAEQVKDKAQVFFGISADKKDAAHELLKLLEMRTGIVTQHCCKRIIMEVADGKPMGANNIMLKFNQKLGGINHTIAPPTQIRNTELHGSSRNWFGKTRMFMGLFVSHAGPQSFADRSAKVPQSEPTVVGIAYSTTQATKQKGFYFMQEPGKQMIGDMRKYIVSALEEFQRETGALPEDILVYRNGKSEGEFAQVQELEGPQFVDACNHVATLARGKGYSPTITIVAVMRNSNYRLFTTGHLDNVNPGTCVGKNGTNAALKEFVLVAQRAIKGTARPTRYTVSYEKQGMTGRILGIDEIKVITNALAYASGIVPAPISVPSPVDSAEKLANRGRNNYKAKLSLEEDSCTASSGPPPSFRNDGNPEFFPRLSKQFEPRLKYQHFWA